MEYFFLGIFVVVFGLATYELIEGILAGFYLDGDDEEIIAPIAMFSLLIFMVGLSYCG